MFEKIFSNPDVVMAIIAVIAIISPIVTSVINNHYQTKRENVKNYELAKRQALNNFINSWLACCNKDQISDNDKLNYYKAFNSLYIYFKDVPDVTNTLFSIKPQYRVEHLNFVITSLAKQIRKG